MGQSTEKNLILESISVAVYLKLHIQQQKTVYYISPLNIYTMNSYETVFILTPVLSEDQAKEAIQKFRKILKDLGGRIIHEESWGLNSQPLKSSPGSSELQDFLDDTNKSTGYYHLFEFSSNNSAVAELEIALKRDERVLRFLTVRLDRGE